jgi:hypothetical protein
MGYTQKRSGRNGKPRYTAVYRNLRGERRSAGTYSSLKDSDKAWQKAELGSPRDVSATLVVGGRSSAATSPRSGFPTT